MLSVFRRLDTADELISAGLPGRSNIGAFPVVVSSNNDLGRREGLLLRAADAYRPARRPNYLPKANALFYAFEESAFTSR